MTETFDAIVVGAGVIGASTAFHLAKLGQLNVCVVDRGPVCSGGTAKSCAIIRSHYSVPTNTQLTVKSIEMFRQFKDWLEKTAKSIIMRTSDERRMTASGSLEAESS